MFKTTTIAAALMGIAFAATPAMAHAEVVTRVEVVYSDLDLTTPEGQRTLETRLEKAARDACGYDRRFTGSRLPSIQSEQCYKQARGKAQDQMAVLIDRAEDARLGG